ncbi:MAG: hypothetical protein Q9O62_13380 [Ardenticatenia bacterium]|nr:hypothetical protein [Ardenticatenia bacterium]
MVDEQFEDGVGPRWVRLIHGYGDQVWSPGCLRLQLRPGPARPYSLSQLDDYHHLSRRHDYPWRPALRLTVQARFSHREEMVGTAGFGLWNAPFSGEVASSPVVAPQAAWFFYASPHSHLALSGGWSGHGFFAQAVRGPAFPSPLITAGWWLARCPLVGRLIWRMGASAVPAGELPLEVEPTDWHTYRLEWTSEGVWFFVDNEEVGRTPVVPRPPLAFVAWMDNQYQTVSSGEGGLVPIPEAQWLDLARVRVEVLKSE